MFCLNLSLSNKRKLNFWIVIIVKLEGTMLRRFSNALSRNRTTVRMDVNVSRVTNVPLDAGSCRIVWARDSKIQMTKLAKVSPFEDDDVAEAPTDVGFLSWGNNTLSIIATLDPCADPEKSKGSQSCFMKKEYEFKLQKRDESRGRFVTLGKCTVDLAQYVDSTWHSLEVPLAFGDKQGVIYFDVLIVPVKGLIDDNGEDGDSSISSRGLSGASSLSEEEVIGEAVGDKSEKYPTLVEMDDLEKEAEEERLDGSEEMVRMVEKRNDDSDSCLEAQAEIGSYDVQRSSQDSLLERVIVAERDASEAKRMLEESIDMLEEETSARQQAEESVESLEREIEWLEKKSAKDKSDWERRMKDSLHKMESTVLLLEKVQKEKEEMERREEQHLNEIQKLEQMIDCNFVEEQIKAAEEAAKNIANEQAAVQIVLLQKQIKAMAAKLEAAEARYDNRTPEIEAHLDGISDESNNALVVENQYLRIEIESLKQDVASATAAACRTEQASRRESEVYAQRAADYFEQLQDCQRACSEAERAAAEAHSRIALAEDAMERSNLQAAELRHRLTRATIHSSIQSVDVNKDNHMEDVMRLMREAQDSAETRAAQLASVSQELSSCQDQLVILKNQVFDAQREADDAYRMASSKEEEVKHLRHELSMRDAQRKQYADFQDQARSMLQSTEIKNNVSSSMDCKSGKELERDQVHIVAQQASLAAAELTERLAMSNLEKSELQSLLEESRFELQKARSENDAELRKRVDTLERELVVSQNRAEVNEMFRGEHDRVAKELIDTKVSLAQTQEELVVLRRNLFKSQEKSMNFASKLTKLETKLYRRLSKVSMSPRRKRTSSTTNTVSNDDT